MCISIRWARRASVSLCLTAAARWKFLAPRRHLELQVDQPVRARLKLRGGYLQNDSAGLALLNTVLPDRSHNNGAILLEAPASPVPPVRSHRPRATGQRPRSVSFLCRMRKAAATSTISAKYVGTFPVPSCVPTSFPTCRRDLPNRFLAWGIVSFPRSFA